MKKARGENGKFREKSVISNAPLASEDKPPPPGEITDPCGQQVESVRMTWQCGFGSDQHQSSGSQGEVGN